MNNANAIFNLKKAEKFVFITGLLLCSFIKTDTVMDKTLTLRHIVWSVNTGILVLLISYRAVLGGVDFGKLRRAMVLFFFCYLGVALCSYIKIINFGEWVYECSKIFVMVIYFCAATLIFSDIKELAKPITILAIALCIYGLWSLQLVYRSLGITTDIATMGCKNSWAGTILLFLPFCFTLLKEKGYWKALAISAVLLILANIFLSNARSAILALIVSSIAVAVVFKPRYAIIIIGVFIVGVAVCYFATPDLYDDLTDTGSIRIRFTSWGQSLTMVQDQFMVGAGNWRIAIANYAKGFRNPYAFWKIYHIRPHNDFLWVLCEMSIIGLIIYLPIYGLSYFYTLRGRKYLVFMGLVGYTVTAFFAQPKERAFTCMLFCILLALSVPAAQKIYTLSKEKVLVVLLVLLCLLGFATYDFSVRYNIEKKCYKANIAHKNGLYKLIIKSLDKIPALATVDYYGVPYHFYRGLAYGMENQPAESLQDYGYGYKANPNNIYNLSGLGESFYYSNRHQKAIWCYARILEMRPNYEIATKNIKLIKEDMERKKPSRKD